MEECVACGRHKPQRHGSNAPAHACVWRRDFWRFGRVGHASLCAVLPSLCALDGGVSESRSDRGRRKSNEMPRPAPSGEHACAAAARRQSKMMALRRTQAGIEADPRLRGPAAQKHAAGELRFAVCTDHAHRSMQAAREQQQKAPVPLCRTAAAAGCGA
jgi:hypothetical protein